MDQVRKSVIFSEDLYKRVSYFRFGQHIKSEVDAIRTLVEMGLHYSMLCQDPLFEKAELETVDRLNALAE